MFTALVDLTILSVPATRTRGMGRYAADLARAIGGRASGGATESRVIALERLHYARPATVSDDLAGAAARLTGDRARSWSQASWAYRVRLRLAAAARRVRADVVHSLDASATPLGALNCPRIVTCHDLIALAFPEHYRSWREGWSAGRRRLEARRYARADHIIAVSETTAHDLVARLRVPAGKITVVHHGVDLTRFSPAPAPGDYAVRARHGLGERPYLLYVGGADWRKNPAGMLEALRRVRLAPGCHELELAWAGRIGTRDLALIRRLASDRRLDNALRLLGWVSDDDLAALTRGAVAMLYVSRAEGFGYPIIEAMASGCPVIAGNGPAAAEIADDAALTVDPERPDDIAAAAAALAADADERRRLVERGLERCRVFDIGRMADETVDVYRRVASPAASV